MVEHLEGPEDEADDEQGQALYEHLRLVCDKGQDLLRIDKFLMNRIENATRTKVQAALEAGNIRVNDGLVKSSYRVKPFDVITVLFARPPRDKEILPEPIPLNIVYEDDDVVVVNKPAGLVVHPGHGNYSGTLINGLMHHFQHLPHFQEKHPRPGLVHRIDKDTTGLILLAKTEFSLSFLARQFFDRTVFRRYQALVWGELAEDSGTIVGNLGRNPRDRMQMTVFPEGDQGKPAITHFRVLERFRYLTLVECRLETGRTHQIRAHFKYLGHPLFGDVLYGGNRVLKGQPTGSYRQFVENCLEILPRQALHAKSLGFVHPTKREAMSFDSELPSDMVEVMSRWRKMATGWGN